ncbi:MAG: uroporphyrinogen decarboxylase family protein [Spirochaetota bacterium]
MTESERPLFDVIQQLVSPSESFLQHFGVDVRNVAPDPGSGWKLRIEEGEERFRFVDEWGLTWGMPKIGGHYFDMTGHPLGGAGTTAATVRDLPMPDPSDGQRYKDMRRKAQAIRAAGQAVVVSSIGAGIFELGGWLRGYEDFYCDLAIDEELAASYLDRFLDIKLEYWKRVFDELGDLVDVAQEADDLGSQNAMLVSPDTYRRIMKPRHRKLFSYIHGRGDAKVFYHSCGSFHDVLGDLVETGVDILNPVQFNAKDMDAVSLKRDFGKDLVFWGGGVDTQDVLPRRGPAEVRDDVRRQIEILAPGGGFIFNTVHNIQNDVPPENIVAMFETLEEYGIYPVSRRN